MSGPGWRRLGLVAGGLLFSGCAAARVDLGSGRLPLLPQVDGPMPVRLAVAPIEDARPSEARAGYTGLFVQAVGDVRLNEDVPGTVTALLRRHLSEAGLLADVGVPDPAAASPAERPELLLRGRLVALSGERDAHMTPVLSVMTLPLVIPLAIAGTVRAVPSPISILVPVRYAGRSVLEVELVDAGTEAVLWRREIAGAARQEVEGWADLFTDRGRRMAEVARDALGDAVAQLMGALTFALGGPAGRPEVPSPTAALGQ